MDLSLTVSLSFSMHEKTTLTHLMYPYRIEHVTGTPTATVLSTLLSSALVLSLIKIQAGTVPALPPYNLSLVRTNLRI